MKWEMEVEEIEAVLEKIWDLHDKLSDAIHSISRTHFIHSLNKPTNRNPKSQDPTPHFFYPNGATKMAKSADDKTNNNNNKCNDDRSSGFVFVKDFRVEEDDDAAAVQEAKSLNAIRTALEHLEDQLEFFHTVQIQQRAERDTAIARLEQSRIILAMRLAEHHGKKYKVIEEAQALVGDVRDAGYFVSSENHYGASVHPSGQSCLAQNGKKPNLLMSMILSSFNFVRKSLKLDHMGGILGNAALVAVSMIALMHLQQVNSRDRYVLDFPQRQEDFVYSRNRTRVSRPGGSSSGGHLADLDVLSARG